MICDRSSPKERLWDDGGVETVMGDVSCVAVYAGGGVGSGVAMGVRVLIDSL